MTPESCYIDGPPLHHHPHPHPSKVAVGLVLIASPVTLTSLIATYAIPESRCATCDAGNYPLIAPTSDAVIRSSCNRAQVSVLLLMVCMHKLILLPALKEAPVPYNTSPCSMALLSCNTRPSQRGRVHNQTLNMIACSDPISLNAFSVKADLGPSFFTRH